VVSCVEEALGVDGGRYPGVRILYQTTLNAEEYEAVARAIEARAGAGASRTDTICYATKENQDAARALAQDPEVDLILVIGGKQSANTHHLWEICARTKPSLIQGVADLDPAWFEGVSTVGLTAGASTPDYVIEEVEAAVQQISQPA
jgi:4-hydroxy-3-methylbut-2-enyl diphosphate reductase